MDVFRINGAAPLSGQVVASGAKNAALPLMAAALLSDEPLHLDRVPHLRDVSTLRRLLASLGVESYRRGQSLTLETIDRRPIEADSRLVQKMRASFCVLGPLLARRGRAIVPLPGGCRIGPRPVDIHLSGLAALGAEIRIERGRVVATARRLQGASIDLAGPRGPSVTATANVLCAAVLARGKSTLEHAAREPEIADLARCLMAMGARIEGIGTGTLSVDGVERLHGAAHRVIADRIEAGTLLLAGAITGGVVCVSGIEPLHLGALCGQLVEMGAAVEVAADSITVAAPAPLRAADVLARPHPGLPTDLQAQCMALACVARGRTQVRDEVFPERLAHALQLVRLGADIRPHANGVVVRGATSLIGAPVEATDLRASAALVLAGLAAQGETIVHGVQHLDRGYDRLELKLAALGANVVREPAQEVRTIRYRAAS